MNIERQQPPGKTGVNLIVMQKYNGDLREVLRRRPRTAGVDRKSVCLGEREVIKTMLLKSSSQLALDR